MFYDRLGKIQTFIDKLKKDEELEKELKTQRIINRQDFKKTVRIKILFKWLNKSKVFKMYCQKSITYKIKHEKHTIVNITNKDGEKKLEQRIV